MSYVGNEMGGKRYKVAQKYVQAGVIIFIGIATFTMLTLWLLRNQWATFYSNENLTVVAM